MKLESSPKLDSKISQKSNKESESKQAKKIQRAKNTCDSKQSKKPTKSQKSKIKSFIRTIPISIALASALTSNAVAEWTHGNRTNRYEIVNGIINQNLTLITTHGYITFQGSTDTTNLTINANVTGEGVSGGGPQNGLIALSGNNIVGGTITNNANFSVGGSSKRGLAVNEYAILKSFVNNSSFKHTGSNSLIYVRAGGTIQNITNNGEMSVANVTNPNDGWKSVIRLEDYRNLTGARVDAINFIGNSTTSNVNNAGTKWNVISIGSATSSIGAITARDNAKIYGHFAFDQGTIRNITFQDSANMTGDISLANSAKITNGITIGGNSSGGSGNNASLTGDISLTNNSRIQGGIVLDNSANMTGNISLSTANGGGNITIDSINIGNGSTMTGDISVLGNSKITDSITIAGILDGNVSAIWNTGGNGTINRMDISGEITKKVQLDNETKIATLNLNGGTITGGINFQGLTTNPNGDTAIIGDLTLNSDAYIGGIDIGNTSGGNAKGVISNLTLNDTASIGSIVNNRGTISELILNNDSTITNGITNASGGTISNITLASSNTINNGITNNSGGNIGTIISDTGTNVNNIITNHGTIGSLEVNNQGTIVYRSDNGIITDVLSVAGGATLDIKDSSGNNTGTIELRSDGATLQDGSTLNLANGSTLVGHLKNSANLAIWTNESNIQGHFINTGTIGELKAGNIQNNFLNEGSITNLTIDKNIGTLTNNGSGVINTLTIQNNSIITNGITNDSNIGSLNLQNNTTYSGTGSITNALDIANNKTLTATNNGIKILFANGATGTIDNAGIISGNLNNQNGSTIKTFNTGSISGSIANNATIQELNVTGNVTNGITNNSNIAKLNVNSNVTYAGAGSITNALDIDGAQTQFTISNGAGNTLTLTNTAGANSVKTITNEGTIIGNLINDLTSTNWTFGVLQGNFTNNGNLTAFNTGSITGNLTNGNNGIINTLNTSKVGGSIANNGNLVNVIVDSNKTLTGNGSITNSLVVQDNSGNGYTLTIDNGSGGTGNLKFHATNGTIDNAGTINGNITNVDGSLIGNFTNSGSFEGNLTNNGNITNFINSGNFIGNITNTAGDTISNFNNQANITGNITNEGIITDFNNAGNINGTLTNANNANIGNFTNSGSIKEFNNQGLIAFFANNGIITIFSGNGTIYGVSNNKVINGNFENVANALKNTGTISGNVELVGQRGTCSNDICKLSGLWNEGTIGGTFTNAANKTINSVINGSNSQTNINVVLNGGIANDGIITNITNYNNGTINNGITNNANANIESITNQGTINGGITNSSQIGMINNTGLITGNLTNKANSIITTINTGSITGSIANSGSINTLNVTGNVNNGITNNANIGSLIVNESVSYKGNGSITNALEVAKDKTLTANSGITFHATKGNVNNLGTIAGNLTLEGSSNSVTNSGSITTIINNANDSSLTNNSNIGALEVNKNLNYSGSGSITNSIDIASNTTLTTNGITLNATKGSVNNLGTLAGALTLEGSSNSVTNSGSITTIINNANNSTLANHSNIGVLEVNKNLNYSGSGSITNYAIIAENTTLNNSTALIFASNNQGLENKGIITGSLENKGNMQLLSNSGTTSQINGNITNSGLIANLANQGTISGDITNNTNSTITSFKNSGTISGNLYNDGHIDTLHNTGTMGTIYNRSKNTIKELRNDKNSVIARIDNSNGRYDLIQNQGTILGDIKNDNGTITNLVNTNNGTITGQIISNSSSNSENNYIGTIINAGVINSSHTMNSGSIQDKTNDAIFLDTISNVVTTISNSGSINGNVRVAGNSEVNVIENSKVIAGCIILEGGRIGKIDNTNGATANCMSFSNGASVDNLNNSGTIKESITNDSGSITINNGGSGSIGGITTSNGGNTTIINGGIEGNTVKPGGHIGAISNTGSNSNTHIDGWTLDNPDNPKNPIIIADGSNTDGIHLKEDSIFVEGNLESGKIYDYYGYIKDENGNSIGQDFSQDDELFNALTFIPIFNPTDNGDGTFSVGLDTQELSGKTLGASLIYSSRMRQIDTNSMLREINVKNFKTDFEILEQRERLKNQQALLENYKQQRESYLNGLTKDNKELKRVSSKESTSLATYANNSNIKSDAIEVVDYYNKDALASLDNLQATTKANQETYSNLDLCQWLKVLIFMDFL